MSFLDKIVSAITPTGSDEDRAEARRAARAEASDNDWFTIVIDQHEQIEAALADAVAAADPSARTAALERLKVVLIGHAGAEELVLYPAMVEAGEKARAALAYEEQAMTKIQMAKLDKLDPSSSDWAEKIQHIQGALQEHIYEEESSWLPELHQKLPARDQQVLTSRFKEEFERCANPQSTTTSRAGGGNAPMPNPIT